VIWNSTPSREQNRDLEIATLASWNCSGSADLHVRVKIARFGFLEPASAGDTSSIAEESPKQIPHRLNSLLKSSLPAVVRVVRRFSAASKSFIFCLTNRLLAGEGYALRLSSRA